jgi:tyrosine-protein kinase Etk/Wzc
MTVKRLLYKLYRGRRLLIGVMLGILAIAVYLAFATKPRYTAQASFLPPSSGSSAGGALLAQVSALSAGGLLAGLRTSGDQTVGIMASRTIVSDMVRRFHLMDVYGVKRESVAEQMLQNATSLSVGLKDNIVSVSVSDGSPARARDMANAYLDELQTLTDRMALTESSQRRLFYERQLAREKDALSNAEIALKRNEEQSGLIAPAGQTNNELQATAQLRSEIASREVELASLLHDETEQNPDVVRVRKQLESLRAQVAQMENGKTGPSGGLTRAQVPALELEFVRLQREVKYHETLFDILSKQYEAARLDESHDVPLQILDHAVEPDHKSGPKRLLILLFGTVLGLLAGILAVLLRDLWRNFEWDPETES